MISFRRVALGLVALATVVLASPAHRLEAQNPEIRGVVRDSATGQPVAGAVVMALDAIGNTLARTITSERGQYRLNRPANTLLVRAVRLGFRQATERLPLVNAEVMTVEGMMQDGKPHPLQSAFADLGAAQCGYCIPGILLTAKVLLDENPQPTRDEIRQSLSGNLCRCTGYTKILQAVELAAKEMNG